MGTRNLQMVINRQGKTKVAQYSQWDGYPSGQGIDILNFLRNVNLKKFEAKVNKLHFARKKEELEVDDYLKEIGAENGWMTMDQSKLYQEKYFYLSRDCGAKVFNLIMEDKVRFLTDSSSFRNDGLFCEYTYIIDFSLEKFIIYENGYNKLKSYNLNNLPTPEKFLKDLKGK